MRQLLRHLTLLCLVVALLPAAVALPASAQTETVLVPDDELVLINRDARIVVKDPYTPPGNQQLNWESPQTGFGQVATGDFNGDGTAEIVGLRGGEAYVFDPYRQPGELDVTTIFTATPAGQVWQSVATGRFFSGNRDGLVLVQSLDQGTIRARLVVYLFQGTSWTQNYVQEIGAGFQGLSTGDVDGDGLDELAGIRGNQIIMFDPTANWATIFAFNYDFPWVFITVGNIDGDPQSRQEIVTSCSGVGSNLNSYLAFRYFGSSSSLETVLGEIFNPNFTKIALADVTGNGDDEVFLLRPGIVNNVPIVALTSRNYGGDPMSVQFNELANQTRFGNINAGDTDGDGKDEVIVMAADEYLIYTEPATSLSFQSYPGLYSTSLNFAVGNLDGSGISQGPQLSVSPTSVNLTLQAGQTGTRTVQINNVGTGTFNWTSSVTQGSTWLSIQPAGGAANTTAVLQIDARNLPANVYFGNVRITADAGTANSPQDIAVSLTVTAVPFSANPAAVSWLYTPPSTPGTRSVTVTGPGISWHAGVVPIDSVQRIQAAIDAGFPIAIENGSLVLGDSGEVVAILNYLEVNPSSSSTSPTNVTLTLLPDNVPYGLSLASVVFVPDNVTGPPPVVVRVSVLRTVPGASDLRFLPVIVNSR